MRFSAPLKGHALLDRDEKIPYKGFHPPGRGSDALAEKLGKALEARLDFGALTAPLERSEEHTSELQSLMRISYAVFCLKKKKTKQQTNKESITDNLTNKQKNDSE